jgi:ribosomal-protein-alanine N-acetyltransferase
MNTHIRLMIRRDMAEVLEIERASFDCPWSDEQFIFLLRQRNCIGMVAEHENRVVGFMIYELNRTNIHLLNFAVAAGCRQLGVGREMIGELRSKLRTPRERLVTEVRESNLDAQYFFRGCGLRASKVLYDHYDTGENAYQFNWYAVWKKHPVRPYWAGSVKGSGQ